MNNVIQLPLTFSFSVETATAEQEIMAAMVRAISAEAMRFQEARGSSARVRLVVDLSPTLRATIDAPDAWEIQIIEDLGK
jgi:hypothetical protein